MSKLKIEINETLGNDYTVVNVEKGAVRHTFNVPTEKISRLKIQLAHIHNIDIAEAYIIAAGGSRIYRPRLNKE